ncbi:MAG TPA: hypothetical protein VJI46_06340 [Candidatus Nanoarchaeia archaeon]|nr:hypothetical protein [Candidatus Nanoarchaeia archaeon]
MTIEDAYEKLRKKYSLPAFKGVDRDFSVSAIENERFLLREINANMMEKLELVIALITELLQPDTNNVASIHEFRAFDEKEKKELYDFYCKLMTLHRKGVYVSISGEEKKEADFLKELHSDWGQIKSKMKGIVSKMETSWKEEATYKTELGYLG